MAIIKRPYSGRRVAKRQAKKNAPARAGAVRRKGFAAWWGRRRLSARISLIIAALLLIFIGGTALAIRLWISRPPEVPIVPNRPSPSGEILPSGASPAQPSGGAEVSPQGYVKRDGVYTFILAGANQGLTDTLMVATLDTKQGTCHVLSIPRDTAVESAPRTIKKINSAYSQQKNVDEPGIAQMKKEIATLIGFQPQYAAVVDYNGFKRLITAIDGIDFNVPMNMRVDGEGINLQKGQQHLNADQALQLVRFRVNYIDGKYGAGYDDYGRMAMQQEVLKVAAKKALANWTKFPEYIKIAQDNLKSDIDWGNLLWFAEQIKNIGMDNVVFHSLPTYTVHNANEISGTYYEAVRAEEALALINETINPFSTPIGAEIVEYIALTEK
ncbi:MAG: LCP family protein [Oscillospiraceae bacterium]|jgi:LCP family protein required for cell wall assembly|nr:LCP family protein [Oscillospiraceae bacterium]